MKTKEYQEEIESEQICDQCGYDMKLVKIPRKSYEKHKSYFQCENCGNIHRKRTFNEILRDRGLRDEED
jgi:uncharacterized Zn finger protein